MAQDCRTWETRGNATLPSQRQPTGPATRLQGTDFLSEATLQDRESLYTQHSSLCVPQSEPPQALQETGLPAKGVPCRRTRLGLACLGLCLAACGPFLQSCVWGWSGSSTKMGVWWADRLFYAMCHLGLGQQNRLLPNVIIRSPHSRRRHERRHGIPMPGFAEWTFGM